MPEIIRKVKARFDRNPRRSGRKIAHEQNISQLELKPLKFQKVQELMDKKSQTLKSQGVTSLERKWPVPNLVFSDEKPFQIEQFFKQNKMIVFICQRDQLKIYTCDWPTADGNGVGRHNGRWSLFAYILRPWGQNKCRILSEKCVKDSIEALGRQTFRPHSNRTQHHRTQHALTKNGLKKKFLASFLTHNDNQNLQISIRWTFTPGAFWRIRFSLKKYESVDHLKTALRREWTKIPRSHFRVACDSFVGRLNHNWYQRWPIRRNQN